MAEQNDPLAGEISVEAALTESGVKASAKSRFIVAIDRLLGAAVDIPGSIIEGKARLRRLSTELELEARRQSAELELQSASDLQRLAHASKVAAMRDSMQRQINKSHTVLDALEDLSDDPPIEDVQSPIDDDWLNIFGEYAERASSDRMQSLWGKILSGEVRRPGSFSFTTLRILAELDQQTARLFQDVLERSFQGHFIVLPESIGGQFLLDVNSLEEVGLLQGAGGTMTLTQRSDDSGAYTPSEGSYLLMCKGTPNSTFTVSVAGISRAGREIMTILPKPDGREVLRKIADIGKPHLDSIELAKIIERLPNNQVRYQEPTEKIK